MTRQSGSRAKSNGAEFEDYLERVVFKAALDSGYFARIDKQNPTYVASRSRAGVTFKPRKSSGADWIAMGGTGCKWGYIAIEAKSVDGDSLARSEFTDEQVKHLQDAEDQGQLGLVIVKFARGIYVFRWWDDYFKPSGRGRSLGPSDLPAWNKIQSELEHTIGKWPR